MLGLLRLAQDPAVVGAHGNRTSNNARSVSALRARRVQTLIKAASAILEGWQV